LVEFGDYQCHFCAAFQRDTKDSILQNFVNTGQVRFLFNLAAEASYCAADQGKYWQYHDEIYKNSKGEYVAWVTKDILKQFASNVNIPNIKKFSERLDSQNHSNIVEQNDNLASIGLQATPSFILLSTAKSQQEPLLIDGAQPYSVFQQAIAKVQSST
jgi:protein-disulfide isomerase